MLVSHFQSSGNALSYIKLVKNLQQKVSQNCTDKPDLGLPYKSRTMPLIT